jgi:hypothetical protein
MKNYLFLFLTVSFLSACDSAPQEGRAEDAEVPYENEDERSDGDIQLAHDKIMDISVLDVYSSSYVENLDKEGRLEKGELNNAEGTFNVYYISNESGERLGYVMEDNEATGEAGDLYVTSSDLESQHGLRVGDTYADMLERVEEPIKAFGSEIESQTTITIDQTVYELDVPNNTYEVDENTIPKETKIKGFMIKRSQLNTQEGRSY